MNNQVQMASGDILQTRLFSGTNGFHFFTRYNDVIFISVDIFDLLLKNETSYVEIGVVGEIIF